MEVKIHAFQALEILSSRAATVVFSPLGTYMEMVVWKTVL
jgi:hypothetical protein